MLERAGKGEREALNCLNCLAEAPACKDDLRSVTKELCAVAENTGGTVKAKAVLALRAGRPGKVTQAVWRMTAKGRGKQGLWGKACEAMVAGMIERCSSAEDFGALIKVRAAREAGFPSEDLFRRLADDCAEDVVMNWEEAYAGPFERWMLGALVDKAADASASVADRVQAVSLLRIVMPGLGAEGKEAVAKVLVAGMAGVIDERR